MEVLIAIITVIVVISLLFVGSSGTDVNITGAGGTTPDRDPIVVNEKIEEDSGGIPVQDQRIIKMKIIIALLALSLPFISTTAHANDHYLFAPIGSYHVEREKGECEINPGLYYQRYWNDNMFWTTGVFRNSRCNTSVIAMVGWESHDKKRILGIPYGYGAMVGPATGYQTPITGATYLRIGDRDAKLSARILILPHPTQGIYGLGISYKL